MLRRIVTECKITQKKENFPNKNNKARVYNIIDDKLDARELKRCNDDDAHLEETIFPRKYDDSRNDPKISCAQWSHPKKGSPRRTQNEQINTEHTWRKIPLQHRHKKKERQEHNNTLTKQQATDRERGERDVRGLKKSANKNEELCFGPSSKSRTFFLFVFLGLMKRNEIQTHVMLLQSNRKNNSNKNRKLENTRYITNSHFYEVFLKTRKKTITITLY